MKKVMIAALALGLAQANEPTSDPTMITQYDKNFIANGDFDDFDLNGEDTKSVSESDIENWEILNDKQGEVGLVSQYSDQWNSENNNKAIKLTKDMVYSQDISITKCSYYRLKFQFATLNEANFENSAFQVKFNDQVVADVTPEDTNVNTYNVIIRVQKQDSNIKFIGKSSGGGNGVSIDNIQLYKVVKYVKQVVP